MNDIMLDKGILFLYCMLGLQITDISPEYIIACLAALTLSSLNFAFRNPRFSLISGLGYALLTLWAPDFSHFLPLAVYDWQIESLSFSARKEERRWFVPLLFAATGFISAVGLLRFYPPLPQLLFLLFGCFLAWSLRLRTEKYHILHQRYQKTRDDGTEKQILLEEKNQSLRDRQDSEIYAATLRERNRIAREIHDNVGHMLTRSILMVGALKITRQEPELATPLAQLEDTLNQAMNSIRRSVHDLHDSSVNLQDTLQALIRDYTFCPVTLHYEMSPEVPRDVKYSFIAIVKEALVNISRHSNASQASVTAVEHPGFYQLIIQDNGSVNPPGLKSHPETFLECEANNTSGIGLSNIESRIKALNGSVRFQKKEGFRIYITVPKDKEML